jgi:hypothetical protein
MLDLQSGREENARRAAKAAADRKMAEYKKAGKASMRK